MPAISSRGSALDSTCYKRLRGYTVGVEISDYGSIRWGWSAKQQGSEYCSVMGKKRELESAGSEGGEESETQPSKKAKHEVLQSNDSASASEGMRLT